MYIRAPVKTAVACCFYNQGWISKPVLDEGLPTKVTNPTDVSTLMRASLCFFQTARILPPNYNDHY
ncbi:hypothetical protein BCV72DRAFT_219283 [Rhizopus microsporus var. microsporus]|uniref:Uncharacterized protein n=2 Tax=Rhizopus microsporus TaxID=58291 RepID=A0A2G4T8X0_RHIZD|nr:uncharacterized protein RHIMIDRAFT_253996 [Rhizopus microsporus ATCC 52813]ORE11969.1 hypothetical protein BCV72DRAFT_219283 [Rhizopus microsporus var. microsporus]PHZ17461.1 hypothetical protein RHIMIDRAFT_253996 [Rhizopus microsporus ATCC 52813]